MRTLTLLLLSGLLLAGCASAPPAALQASADRVVQALVASSGFSGAVVLMRDGQVVYERAVGLAERQPDRPFTVDTASDGGSLAKTLTAAIVWELAAEGRLSLDDPATRHLPEYPYAGQTLRQLVTHRNGLPDYEAFDADFAPGQVRDTADLLRATARRQPQPLQAPGVSSEYSNLGFDAAALVVERVEGRRIEAVWRERYLAPLGITGLFARPARFADWPVPRTPGYERRGDAWEANDAFDGEAHIGASNVHASARDWARWGNAFAQGRVMAGARLEAGLRQPMLDSGFDAVLTALSWYCDAARQRCHYTGAYNGFYAQVMWDRTRRETLAYVSNSTLAPWQCARFTRDLADVLAGRTPTPESAPVLNTVKKGDRARYAGRYRAPELGLLNIDQQDSKLFLRVNGGDRVSLFAVPDGVFYAPMLDLWLGFTGAADAATLHIRSVFHVADATRLPAPAGPSR
ncbi:MAG: serine hydrolase domain-containing protein [Rubrivivax sp.]|nr:serine hydrolase domain-containing protein [Rubrivivax sp.]